MVSTEQSAGTTYPKTSDDDVDFDGSGGNNACVLGVSGGLTVNSVDVSGTYAGQIMLQNPLTIAGSPSATSLKGNKLKFNAPAAAIRGYTSGDPSSVTPGDLYLASNIASSSGMIWSNGKFSNVTIHVARTSATAFAAAVVAPGTTKQMNGTAFDVDGQLGWAGGAVVVTNPQESSSITINQTGKFFVNPGGGSWGVAGTDPPSTFGVVNNGRTDVLSDATFNGNFTNAGNLYVGPTTAATVTLGGVARQTGSSAVTLLGKGDGTSTGTIKVTGTGTTLQILDGQIAGQGAVDGNLTLGYDPAPGPVQASSPVLWAGPADTTGDLTVTKSFQSFTTDATVRVKVGDGGATSKLVVQGDAALLGTLAVDGKGTKPPARQEHLLVTIGGTRTGTFGNFAEGGTLKVGNVGADPRTVPFKTTYEGGAANKDVSIKKFDSTEMGFLYSPGWSDDGRVTLTLSQAGGILAGVITDCQDAGGSYSTPITYVHTDGNDEGSWELNDDVTLPLYGVDLTAGFGGYSIRVGSWGEMVRTVASTPGAFGYAPLERILESGQWPVLIAGGGAYDFLTVV